MRVHFHAAWLGGALLVGAVACGGASKPATAPPGGMGDAAGPEPQTVEEAQAQIEQARARLGLGPAHATPVPGPTPSSTAPLREPSTTPTGPASTATAESASETECVTPCRAIASMRRAVASLCRLAGELDDKCIDARKVLQESEDRVAKCGC